jgi:hypothetical protein
MRRHSACPTRPQGRAHNRGAPTEHPALATGIRLRTGASTPPQHGVCYPSDNGCCSHGVDSACSQVVVWSRRPSPITSNLDVAMAMTSLPTSSPYVGPVMPGSVQRSVSNEMSVVGAIEFEFEISCSDGCPRALGDVKSCAGFQVLRIRRS